MSVGEAEQLLDLIYEAAAVPDMWPAILDTLAKMVGGVGTFLITTDTRNFRWTHSESVSQLGLDFSGRALARAQLKDGAAAVAPALRVCARGRHVLG